MMTIIGWWFKRPGFPACCILLLLPTLTSCLIGYGEGAEEGDERGWGGRPPPPRGKRETAAEFLARARRERKGERILIRSSEINPETLFKYDIDDPNIPQQFFRKLLQEQEQKGKTNQTKPGAPHDNRPSSTTTATTKLTAPPLTAAATTRITVKHNSVSFQWRTTTPIPWRTLGPGNPPRFPTRPWTDPPTLKTTTGIPTTKWVTLATLPSTTRLIPVISSSVTTQPKKIVNPYASTRKMTPTISILRRTERPFTSSELKPTAAAVSGSKTTSFYASSSSTNRNDHLYTEKLIISPNPSMATKMNPNTMSSISSSTPIQTEGTKIVSLSSPTTTKIFSLSSPATTKPTTPTKSETPKASAPTQSNNNSKKPTSSINKSLFFPHLRRVDDEFVLTGNQGFVLNHSEKAQVTEYNASSAGADGNGDVERRTTLAGSEITQKSSVTTVKSPLRGIHIVGLEPPELKPPENLATPKANVEREPPDLSTTNTKTTTKATPEISSSTPKKTYQASATTVASTSTTDSGLFIWESANGGFRIQFEASDSSPTTISSSSSSSPAPSLPSSISTSSSSTTVENYIPSSSGGSGASSTSTRIIARDSATEETTGATTRPTNLAEILGLRPRKSMQANYPHVFSIGNQYQLAFEPSGDFRVGQQEGVKVLGMDFGMNNGASLGHNRLAYGKRYNFGPLSWNNGFDFDLGEPVKTFFSAITNFASSG